MKTVFKYILVIGLLALLVSFGADLLAQCPMCKAAVETGKNDGVSPMAEGLNNGILYLFVLPYLMVGLIGFLLYRGYKNRKKAEAAAQAS